MHIRSSTALSIMVLLALIACSAPDIVERTPVITPPLLQDPPGTPFVRPSPPASSDPIASQRPPMPSRFPVPELAEAALVDPDDPTMIGHWFVPTGGYDIYNFYRDELPRAGYPIEGLYPGDIVAIIRFDEGSQILQVYLTGDLEQTDLILRTDLP